MDCGCQRLECSCSTNGVPIYRSKWNVIDLAVSRLNQKALNTIYSTVDVNIFTLISTWDSEKETWDIMQTTFEGTNRVRDQRLQQLTLKFEAFKVEEHETIEEFHTNLCGI